MECTGHNGGIRNVCLRPTLASTGSGTCWRSLMSTVISSGDTSFSASAGKRLFVRSNAYANTIPDENESILFWITFRPISVRRYDAGCERTMFASSGRRPTLHGSIGSNASSPKSGSSVSTTPITGRIASFSAPSVGSSATATSGNAVRRQKRKRNLNY